MGLPRHCPDKLGVPDELGENLGHVHIFIFVRRCDLHFTLLLDLFRQVKANELLMNKSVKYSPLAQLPILMLLISPAFCAVFSYKAPNVSLQVSSLGRDIST